jgi:hypothetical protein
MHLMRNARGVQQEGVATHRGWEEDEEGPEKLVQETMHILKECHNDNCAGGKAVLSRAALRWILEHFHGCQDGVAGTCGTKGTRTCGT